MIEIFVTENGEERTQSEMVQNLMSRVTELEKEVISYRHEVELLISRICYLENQI